MLAIVAAVLLLFVSTNPDSTLEKQGPDHGWSVARVGPIKGVVVVVHGLNNKPETMDPLIAALATKSLHLLPIALVVVTLIVMSGSRSAITTFFLSAAFTGALVTWPWGFEEVWNQYVLFHLSKSAPLDPIGNLTAFRELLWVDRKSVV